MQGCWSCRHRSWSWHSTISWNHLLQYVNNDFTFIGEFRSAKSRHECAKMFVKERTSAYRSCRDRDWESYSMNSCDSLLDRRNKHPIILLYEILYSTSVANARLLPPAAYTNRYISRFENFGWSFSDYIGNTYFFLSSSPINPFRCECAASPSVLLYNAWIYILARYKGPRTYLSDHTGNGSSPLSPVSPTSTMVRLLCSRLILVSMCLHASAYIR